MYARYRRHKHPWYVYVLGPVICLAGAYVAGNMLLYGCIWMVEAVK